MEKCPQCGKEFELVKPVHPWWWNGIAYCSKRCREIVANKDLNDIMRRQNIADEKKDDDEKINP